MKTKTKEKVLKNALILEQLTKLDKFERKEALDELLVTNTQRGLAAELNIPYSTLHDWVTLRQNNTGKQIHMSLDQMYRKLIRLEPKDVKDWGRLEMIKERIEELIRNKT